MVTVGHLDQIPVPMAVSKNIYLDIIQLKGKKKLFNVINYNWKHFRKEVPWGYRSHAIRTVYAYIKHPLKSFESLRTIRFGIFYRRELIGTIIITAFLEDKTFELGYWIDASFQGCSIVSSSCSALLKLIYEEFGAKSAIIRCSKNNAKSQAIAESLGFVQQGLPENSRRLAGTSIEILTYHKTLLPSK